MTNGAQIHELYNKVKIKEILMFLRRVFKFGDLLQAWQQMQNFSISQKLCWLVKKHGDMGCEYHTLCNLLTLTYNIKKSVTLTLFITYFPVVANHSVLLTIQLCTSDLN